MPWYDLRCDGCDHIWEQKLKFPELNDVAPCPSCGCERTFRRFGYVAVNYAGGQQAFHDNTARDAARRNYDKLEARYGKKRMHAEFDIDRSDPEDTPPPPRPAPVTEAQVDKMLSSSRTGRQAMSELLRGDG